MRWSLREPLSGQLLALAEREADRLELTEDMFIYFLFHRTATATQSTVGVHDCGCAHDKRREESQSARRMKRTQTNFLTP